VGTGHILIISFPFFSHFINICSISVRPARLPAFRIHRLCGLLSTNIGLSTFRPPSESARDQFHDEETRVDEGAVLLSLKIVEMLVYFSMSLRFG